MPDDDRDESGPTLRAFHRLEAAELRRDVDRVDRRVESHEKRLDDLGEGHARVSGEVQHLARAYERAASIVVSQANSDLEIRKARELADIRDRSASAKQRRVIHKELVFKAMVLVMGAWAIVSSMMASRC